MQYNPSEHQLSQKTRHFQMKAIIFFLQECPEHQWCYKKLSDINNIPRMLLCRLGEKLAPTQGSKPSHAWEAAEGPHVVLLHKEPNKGTGLTVSESMPTTWHLHWTPSQEACQWSTPSCFHAGRQWDPTLRISHSPHMPCISSSPASPASPHPGAQHHGQRRPRHPAWAEPGGHRARFWPPATSWSRLMASASLTTGLWELWACEIFN